MNAPLRPATSRLRPWIPIHGVHPDILPPHVGTIGRISIEQLDNILTQQRCNLDRRITHRVVSIPGPVVIGWPELAQVVAVRADILVQSGERGRVARDGGTEAMSEGAVAELLIWVRWWAGVEWVDIGAVDVVCGAGAGGWRAYVGGREDEDEGLEVWGLGHLVIIDLDQACT